ncbi:MAG: RsmE family RNA methyltransferase [Planctomycetota bacterium]
MSSLWLHVDEVPEAGSWAEISREEARHAFGARRLGTGDAITLFDGRGTFAEARLAEERTLRGGIVAVVMWRREAPRLEPEVTIAFAVPKGDRLSTLLDLATQAGASRLVPIECARSVVDADKLDRGERWQRILAESAKVAKRAWIPELVAGGALGAIAESERARGAALAVAHTAATAPIAAWSARIPAAQPRTVFIGPEGGFEDGELRALEAFGATAVSLGPCVMRVEMAAIAAAVLLRGDATPA